MERAKEVRINRQKTFQELQGDIKNANDAIEKNPPPKNEKKKEEKTDYKSGVRDDVFDKSSFKKSF